MTKAKDLNIAISETESAVNDDAEHLGLHRRMAFDERHMSWVALLRAHTRATERVARSVEGALPLDWFDVMMSLETSPEGGLRVGDLGERLALTRSGLTRLVDRIEAAGLIERHPSSTDRRALYVVLTPKGRDACRENLPLYAHAVEKHFGSRYTQEEAKQLSELLARQFTPE